MSWADELAESASELGEDGRQLVEDTIATVSGAAGGAADSASGFGQEARELLMDPQGYILYTVATWIVSGIATAFATVFGLVLDVFEELLRIPRAFATQAEKIIGALFGAIATVVGVVESILTTLATAAGPFSFVFIGLFSALLVIGMVMLVQLIVTRIRQRFLI